MVVRCNIVTLAILGFLDLKKHLIPNAILLGWIITLIFYIFISATPINPSSIVLSLVVVGIFFPLRQIVKCNAGDFKLYAIMMLIHEPMDSLWICFLSMIISLFPLASGNKLVPLALTTLFGYVTFLLLRLGEFI